MKKGGAKTKTALVIPEGMTEDDVKAAEAFKKPTDAKAIKVKKYYIDKLKVADSDLFNYSTKGTSERGYVSHCAANESRQPIVLDKDEFNEMKTIYENDDDLEFVVYPDDETPKKFKEKPKDGKPLFRQPKPSENESGSVDGRSFPSEENKEVITVVKYGSKPKRVNYYICPRLFCVRDRLLVRYKDFVAIKDREGKPKPANTCPFCKGVVVDPDSFDKDSDRDPNMTVLQRKLRPGSESERQIYIGFLEKKKNPSGMSLPCCFADPSGRFTSDHDEEFKKLGLSPISKGPQAQAMPQAQPKPQVKPPTQAQPKPQTQLQPKPQAEAQEQEEAEEEAPPEVPPPVPVKKTLGFPKKQKVAFVNQGESVSEVQGTVFTESLVEETRTAIIDSNYEPEFFRVIKGVSVKPIVDANRIPLEIVVPKPPKPGQTVDPKSGPQIGLLPEALDQYFEQDSKSDKFASRDIVRKLKPTAKGFLRLGVDNTNLNRSFLSALVPLLMAKDGSVNKIIDNFFDTQIDPKKFLQMNNGSLVNEFFLKCGDITQNNMRKWTYEHFGDKLTSNNIPAIERLICSFESFKKFLHDPEQKKDIRTFYQALAEPGFILPRGLLLIVLEVSVEDVTIKKGDKMESKKEVKFERIKYPPYPITEAQKQSNISFMIHYLKVTRDKSDPEKRYFKNYGWEPLMYVENITEEQAAGPLKPGYLRDKGGRHQSRLVFQHSDRPWPKVVEERVKEFFDNYPNKRAPFTSQFGLDPNALVSITALIQDISRATPNGIVRDSYNRLVGVTYALSSSSEIVSIPVSDDGSLHLNVKNIYFDWDDFEAGPADKIVEFYEKVLLKLFATSPFARAYKPRRLRTQDGKVVGVELMNHFVIPAKEPKDPRSPFITALDNPKKLGMYEWDNNKTIAYDSKFRKSAFEHAGVEDPMKDKYMELRASSVQDEIEDVYQHLRLSFSSWLSRSAGRDMREKLGAILKRNDLPLYEKRKRLDILLEARIIGWLEPSDEDDESELGFLRVDCLTQGQESCTGRCKWKESEGSEEDGKCRIHSPSTVQPNDTPLHVPRLLYLRLVDELIRYASKREEIFSKKVPRLTIRQDAQRGPDRKTGDQYIILEGSPDWNSWWELLRSEWLTSEKEETKVFDQQFESAPDI